MNKQFETYNLIYNSTILYFSSPYFNYSTDKLRRIANILAVKHTWRISQLPKGRKQFDALYEVFKEIK